MNIQQQRKFNNILFLSLLLFATLGCNIQKNKMSVTEIYTGVKIESNEYVYSKESTLKFNGQMYSLRQKAVYGDDGTVKKFIIYKPEGILEYDKEDLIRDKKILDYADLPFSQQWYYANGKLVIDKNHMEVEKIDKTTIKSEQNSRVTFYKIK